ncbi:uncharacterized protein G2W53_026744 [Senna tora]|uniref:Uncharacterized protein n=1 Tax=Senna tora TaxID=362788 RepID=A0A834THR0_9FABA|nr:uncharacterized protein G2W53_026744 [Senna tora]
MSPLLKSIIPRPHENSRKEDVEDVLPHYEDVGRPRPLSTNAINSRSQ